MFTTGHVVLLVDDDPDVLSVTKLALRNMTVFGLPLKIYTAQSKAEALALLKTTLTMQHGVNVVAVALIDVVMETDTAGLELCQYIREDMRNRLTRIYVRTGQPGLAPERYVIDKYDITGYFTKIETTEDKLYSLVKSGIREYSYASTSQIVMQLIQALIAAEGSREQMSRVLTYVSNRLRTDAVGKRSELVDIQLSYIMDGDVIAGEQTGALELQEELSKLAPVPLGEDGDQVVLYGNRLMIKIAETPFLAALTLIAVGTALFPDFEIDLYYQLARAVAGLWLVTE